MTIQKTEIEKWAAEGRHEIAAWFDDQATSGDTATRAGRDALLEFAKSQQAEAIVVSDLSRWTREDAMAAFALLDHLRKSGLRVVTVAEAWLDLSQPFANVVLAALLERNNQMLQTTRTNTSNGLKASQAAGTWIGAVPWGWKRVRELRADGGIRQPGTDYGIEPAEPEELRRIFHLRATGRSWHGIERDVGIRAATVREILTNQVNRKVVGDELFDRAQRSTAVERSDSRSYLLAGLLHCPWCGNRMIGNTGKVWRGLAKAPHYRCKVYASDHPWRAMSERLVIRHVIAALEAVRVTDIDRAVVASRLHQSHPGQAAAMKAYEKRVREIETRRRNIEEGVAKGAIRPERGRQLQAEEDEKEANLPPPPITVGTTEANLSLLESLPALVERARSGWPNEPEVTRATNAVLREVIARVDWPERKVKYRPRIVFAPRYAAIVSIVSAVAASRAPIARSKRIKRSARGDEATLA